ncbi:MAG TPA: hypothetical protein VEI97_14935 [bacterium]|nr:hypothetical protein [bacterium]
MSDSLATPEYPIVCVRCRGARARLECWPGKFVLKAGSSLTPPTETVRKHSSSIARRWDRAIQEGKIRQEGEKWVLAEDVEFDRPSAAEGMACGEIKRAWKDWKTAEGESLATWRGFLDLERDLEFD